MAEITLTELRRTLFRAVDSVLETGEPVVINRKGRRLVLREEVAVADLSPGERYQRYMAQGVAEDSAPLDWRDLNASDYWVEEPGPEL